jgi:glycosyltransferase involved in cell wall biosynthesis
MIAQALRDYGISFEYFSFRRVRTEPAAILHIQWPERFFSQIRLRSALVGSAKLFVLLALARRRRIRVVLTIHNLEAHRVYHPRLERVVWRWLTREVQGCIHLSEDARKQAAARYPALGRAENVVIPHPAYPAPPNRLRRAIARDLVGASHECRILLYFGLVRSYKGVLTLLDAFTRLPDPTLTLVVAGGTSEPGYAEKVRAAAKSDARIELTDRRLDDAELDAWLAACDAVVLPYERVLNSGAAMYALSRGRMVLAPATGSLPELAHDVGERWLQTYAPGTLSASVLRALLDAPPLDEMDMPPLEKFELHGVAARTASFYAELLGATQTTRIPHD